MKLLTVAEVALELRCSAKQVRRIIGAGDLPTLRLGLSGKSDRVHPDDLGAFLARRECRSRSGRVRGRSQFAMEAKSIVARAAAGAEAKLRSMRLGSSMKSTRRKRGASRPAHSQRA